MKPLPRLLPFYCALYYAFVLTDGSFNLFAPQVVGLSFNSMLQHMLAGSVDVDPAVIGYEGFARDGRVYAYFGPFCALLRLPLLPFGVMQLDITVLSSAIAFGLAGWLKLRMIVRLCDRFPDSPNRALLRALLIAALLFGGAQIGLLRASIFQEAIAWADVFALAFVTVALEGLLENRFDAARLRWMALAAMFALLTRVSAGVGLYTALGLLVLLRWPGWRALPNAALLLGIGMVVVLSLNFLRWGNALEFQPLRYYLTAQVFAPERLTRIAEYGAFNAARIPFGLQYYFLPVWVLPDGAGGLLLSATRDRLLDAAELPPSSFLLTDTLALLLGIYATWRRRANLAILLGLGVAPLLMLALYSMNHRYRMEFDPLFTLLGLLGAATLLRAPQPLRSGMRRALIAATIIGMLGSQATLALYQRSPFGPGERHLHHGLAGLYLGGKD